jgi:hypothetical protein
MHSCIYDTRCTIIAICCEKFARMSVWVYHAPMPLAQP